ncbi:MAG: thiol:disulfide interchange protein DsbA/DsbL [Gammaproteobacteria bacterium]|nr:thiol:disulfide interchange protein DsbA/DsbL [Gammaproteobacteria bacterium]MDJ0872551.1 thiol:disulfide interchange protein DsbA/DsbL [Gammaproteobacteria bacterium]
MKAQFATMLAAALLLSAGAVGAAQGTDGIFQIYGQYEKVSPPQPTANPERIEVVELFWYGCPHCYTLEPYLKRWAKKKPDYVEFRRMPAVFNERWALHAQAYYTAEALGVLEQIHEPFFEAIHRHRRPLQTSEQIMAFFAEHGVDKEDFRKAWGSFAVSANVRRATVMSQRYGIDGVPAVIINGKYRTSGSLAGTYPNVIKVINALAQEEHKAIAATPAASDGAS